MSRRASAEAAAPAAAMPLDRHALLHAVFVQMDADGSDYVDKEEFKSIFSDIGEKHAEERLQEIDNIQGRGGDSDGQLSADEFCEFMMEYMADLTDKGFKERVATWEEHLRGSHRKLLLRRVFGRMDVDRSGSVSLEEFKAIGEEDVGADNSAAFFKWIEGAVGNSDGELTSDEWVPFVLEQESGSTDEEFHQLVDDWLEILAKKRRNTLLRQVFLKMDADSSGAVDMDEFANLKDGSEDDDALHMVYHYLDSQHGNSDGELSMEEWINGMKQMGEDMDEAEFEAEVAKWMAALTKNQRQIWRGCYTRGNAHQFVIAGRAAGATHVLFVQHAHTTAPQALVTGGSPPAEGGDEVKLTNRGTAQCMVARDEWFGRLPVRRALLTSPEMCTKETALHMAGIGELVDEGVAASGGDPLLVCPTLGRQDPHSICGELERQKGQAPLHEVLDAEGGETAFGLYAEACAKELTNKLRDSIEAGKAESGGLAREKETYISVFGHQTYLHATAYAVGTAAGIKAEALDDLLNINLGEAEGILVPLYGIGKAAIHLKRPN